MKNLPCNRRFRSAFPAWVGVVRGILLFALVCSLSIDVFAQDRPKRHPNFVTGFKDFKDEEWRDVVIEMWDAHQSWPEDGEHTRAYGRWTEPYLPRYYIGVALFELGCYKEALGQFNQSLLSQREVDGAKEEYKRLVELKQRAEIYVRNGTDQVGTEDCPEWRNWNGDHEGEGNEET